MYSSIRIQHKQYHNTRRRQPSTEVFLYLLKTFWPSQYLELGKDDHFSRPHFALIDFTVNDNKDCSLESNLISSRLCRNEGFKHSLELNFHVIDHTGHLQMTRSIPLGNRLPANNEMVDYNIFNFEVVPFWGDITIMQMFIARATIASLLMVSI